MSDSSQSTAFPLAFGAFALRLASVDLATYGIAYDFLHFGSWTLEVGRRHERLLVQWDGKESSLSCSKCSTSDSGTSRKWTLVSEQSLKGSNEPENILDVAFTTVMLHAGT